MRFGLLLVALMWSQFVLAAPWVTTGDNVAISGYDPVADFVDDEAQLGSSRFEYQWDGVSWWFSSSAHRALFVENPERYAPQFGANCANGLSDGHVVAGDPEIWRIIDGKLYLYYSYWGRTQWAFGVDAKIRSAAKTWAHHLRQ